MTGTTTIATVAKNQLEDVVVALSHFNGHNLIDIRVFADFSGADGEKRPTKKGVTLRLTRLPDLIEALQQAEAEARRRGLIGGEG